MEPIQGYVATVSHKGGKPRYVKFGGGLTDDWDSANVYETPVEAVDSARRHECPTIHHVPGFVAIGSDAMAHLDPWEQREFDADYLRSFTTIKRPTPAQFDNVRAIYERYDIGEEAPVNVALAMVAASSPIYATR